MKLTGTQATIKSMWQKLGRSYPPQLELLPLAVLAISIYLVLSSYGSLPERVPSHFNIWGAVDAYDNRSSILVNVFTGTFMYLLFTVINVLLAVLKDPRGIINLPASRKARLTPARVEELRIFLNRSIFGLKLGIQSLLAYSVYITIEVAQGRAAGLGPGFPSILAFVLAVAGYMVWKAFAMTAPPHGPPGYH